MKESDFNALIAANIVTQRNRLRYSASAGGGASNRPQSGVLKIKPTRPRVALPAPLLLAKP